MMISVLAPTTASTAKELRDLARKIEDVCREAPCMSVAMPIIANAIDHLCAIARIHELNALGHEWPKN